jgi:osmoprotectant transport system ATP-binding protein
MITIDKISKKYGSLQALVSVSLELPEGGTTVLIGPSGCGKSTLLRVLVNLIEPDSGAVTIDGKRVSTKTVEAVRREIGYVIQDGGLFPHLTARKNVTLLADFLNMPSSDTDRRVDELAKLVQIPEQYLERYPSGLSGGQRQRVSLMRALMLDPKVLLLDEPLSALDPITRYELQQELKEIFAKLKKTVVLVTHDMGEAAYFADKIVLIRSGDVVQHGSFDDLLHRPANDYVTSFIQAQRSPLPSLSEAL